MTAGQGELQEVTRLWLAWNDGDESALEKLVPQVYQELRRLAKRQMRREHPEHSLQTTALINEAYLRLVDLRNVQWQNRAHFFALCARLMRRILVDFARSRHYAKRGGEHSPFHWTSRWWSRRRTRQIWWRWTMRLRLWPKLMAET